MRGGSLIVFKYIGLQGFYKLEGGIYANSKFCNIASININMGSRDS